MRSTGRKNGFASNLLGANTMQICANWGINPRGGGTPIHYLHGYVLPKGVSISEAFSRTGYNISNASKLHFCKQPFEIIQGQIAFKNTAQCVNKQTVVLLLLPRTKYKKLAHF